MRDDTVSFCPYCPNPPTPFTNTASAFARYVRGSGCAEELTAVSQPVVVQTVRVEAVQTLYPLCVLAGDVVRCAITVYNRSSLPACGVWVTDPTLDSLLEVGTIRCNGRPVSGDLTSGVLIPGLGAGCSATLTFDAGVPNEASGTITAAARARFTFLNGPCGQLRAQADAAPVLLTVAAPGLEIEKSADRSVLTPEEGEAVYTLTVRNTGSCPLEDVVVTDQLPQGLTYVAGSTRVNGDCPAHLDPAQGIPVGCLGPGGRAVVVFQARAAF